MARNTITRTAPAVAAMILWTALGSAAPTIFTDGFTAYAGPLMPETMAHDATESSRIPGQKHRRMPEPTITTNGATRVESEMIRWALGRFQLAELDLPQFDVFFHDGLEQCQGFIGLYSASRRRVVICNRGGRTTEPRHTVLHEFAHAWSMARLTEIEIDAFVSFRTLESWHSPDLAWWQRGDEQAAEIIAWGLQDTNEYRSIWIRTETCDDLAAAFELITSRRPLHTNTEHCK